MVLNIHRASRDYSYVVIIVGSTVVNIRCDLAVKVTSLH
jgi:hypothetical protein